MSQEPSCFNHFTGFYKVKISATISPAGMAVPFINNTPIFMLISAERQEEQKLNGEHELMQKIGHKFKYYKNTHHGSFADFAYLNVKCPLAPPTGWYQGSTEERIEFFDDMRKDIRKFLEEKIRKHTNDEQNKWKIGGKIHFEEISSSEYLGTIEINMLTREALKEFFDIKIDSCDHNAKALIKKENNQYILSHYEERSSSGHGEEMHATLLYTSKRVDNGHETLKDVYQNLKDIDENLPSDRIPTVEEVAQTYNKIIKPDLKFEISDINLESNELISFKNFKIPYTADQIQEWISSHLNLLKERFPWNNWLYWLPKKYQKKEIFARLCDQRVLKHFHKYSL